MRFKLLFSCVMVVLLAAQPALAHFGMVIPESSLTARPGPVQVRFSFWHPFEGAGMDLEKPREAGVFWGGIKNDLLPALQEQSPQGHKVWQASYVIKKPGDYYFYMTPRPYWEPAEDCFIVHYSKVCLSALGAEEGWDTPLGQRMEILPLTRPYGLYAGNSFRGQVLFMGKPLAGCTVEVEFYNQDQGRKAPSDSHVTQVVKSGPDGTFSFVMPWKGWWGFAALHTDPERKIKKDGKDKDIELGGVIWLYVH